MMASSLVLTDHFILTLGPVLSAMKDVGDEAVNTNNIVVMTQISDSSKLLFEPSSFASVYFIWREFVFPNQKWFEEILGVLKPGGVIVVQMHAPANSPTDELSFAIQRNLLMSGFLESKAFQLTSILQLQNTISYTIKASKPSWEIGSSFSIKKGASAISTKNQINDDMDLIDEDSLLTEEDLKKPQLPVSTDCGAATTRKACRNCTCGRAEAEANLNIKLTAEQINNPQSACGSCGLGDAFRCTTCPYKGLPPFKMGEKVSISGNLLASDV